MHVWTNFKAKQALYGVERVYFFGEDASMARSQNREDDSGERGIG
jgi:hypothetical protein